MQTEKVAVLGQYDMFLVSVAIEAAELAKVSGFEYTFSGLSLLRVSFHWGRNPVEKNTRTAVEPVDYWLGQE